MKHLFNVDELETNPNYFSKYEKRKWTKGLLYYINKQYEEDDFGSKSGKWACSCMNICDKCNFKYQKGCVDCVATIKQVLKEKNIKINYKDFDYQKWIDMVEEN